MPSQKTNGKPKPKTSEEILDRQPPHDLQAEIGVLGSAVLMPDCLDDVTQLLSAEDFYDDAHRRLYQHLCAMHEANRRFDVTLLIDRLKASNDFERVGGSAYLSKIVNSVPNAAHAIYYAEIVRGHATARKLISACTDTLEAAYLPGANQDELVASAESAIARVSDSTIRGNDTQVLSDVLHQSLAALEERMTGRGTRLLNVGLTALENCMGLVPGGVTVLAGRPSMGKSSAGVEISRYVARRGGLVYFATLEMTAMELADRMLSAEARVPYYRMNTGRISQADRLAIIEAAGNISQWGVHFDDRPSMTIAQIGASARRQKRRHQRLDLLVIDYMQLVEPENQRDDRTEQLAKISRATKRLARELQCPVLALAQVNRQATDNAENRPRLQNLKGSGSFEEDADSVVFVHRPAWYKKEHPPLGQAETAEIIVEKNRNGPTDVHEVLFWEQWMSWGNKASAEQQAAAEFRGEPSGRDWAP